MENDKLDKLFENLDGKFDTELPAAGHEQRFAEKLSAFNSKDGEKKTSPRRWRTLSIAASVVLLLGLGWMFYVPSYQDDPVPAEEQAAYPELEKTRYYFSSLIETELKNIRKEATTEDTRIIVNDAIAQLDRIEDDYRKLEEELQNNGYSKQLLHAMITNFQTRITLLQNVMEQIEDIKRLKQNDHEEIRL